MVAQTGHPLAWWLGEIIPTFPPSATEAELKNSLIASQAVLILRRDTGIWSSPGLKLLYSQMPKYRLLIYPAATVQFLLVTGDRLKIKDVGKAGEGNTEDVPWPDSCGRDVPPSGAP